MEKHFKSDSQMCFNIQLKIGGKAFIFPHLLEEI